MKTIKHPPTIRIFLFASLMILFSCHREQEPAPAPARNYKKAMRTFVEDLSSWSKSRKNGWIVIPQNGVELTTTTGFTPGGPDLPYLQAIDAVAQEDLYYGYDGFDLESPQNIQVDIGVYLDQARYNEKKILVINYCSTPSKVDDAYEKCDAKEYVCFAASSRNLDEIPSYPATPWKVNSRDITAVDSIHNFLYLLDPEALGTRQAFISAIASTNYDMVITDLFYGDASFTPAEVEAMRTKANGGTRLVLAYMSIGEAENYRYYWQNGWNDHPPEWLAAENPDWPGNYKVKYWEKAWQDIIFGNNDSYLKKIMDAGFDGVYLDIIDAFEYFEEHGEEQK